MPSHGSAGLRKWLDSEALVWSDELRWGPWFDDVETRSWSALGQHGKRLERRPWMPSHAGPQGKTTERDATMFAKASRASHQSSGRLACAVSLALAIVVQLSGEVPAHHP
jgi:hypothetical protein